jgi:hypothetical protein
MMEAYAQAEHLKIDLLKYCTGERFGGKKKGHLIAKAMEEIYRFVETSYEIWCPRQRSWIDLAGAARRKRWWLKSRRSEPL